MRNDGYFTAFLFLITVGYHIQLYKHERNIGILQNLRNAFPLADTPSRISPGHGNLPRLRFPSKALSTAQYNWWNLFPHDGKYQLSSRLVNGI